MDMATDTVWVLLLRWADLQVVRPVMELLGVSSTHPMEARSAAATARLQLADTAFHPQHQIGLEHMAQGLNHRPQVQLIPTLAGLTLAPPRMRLMLAKTRTKTPARQAIAMVIPLHS